MESSTRILAIADDLTGALEAGAKIAGNGISAVVTTRAAFDDSRTALVIDTETRHCHPADAAARVRAALAARPARLIYKKTDSTLRGNIGAELGAVLAAYPDAPLVYAPAYPRMGRTVKDGLLLVDGVPVHQTAFARDPLNPVRDSSIPRLLAAQCAELAHRIQVCDAETDQEIEHAARTLVRSGRAWLAAGPAAFLEALTRVMDIPRAPTPPFPALGRCLLINGSLHPRSASQAEYARACGWPTVGTLADLRALDAMDALMVFGGDTAYDILRSLGEPVLWPYGEIVPGVPFARMRVAGRDLYLMTKAGGFGPVDLVRSIRSRL
jgi:D-threonate/D-erythronate kinase